MSFSCKSNSKSDKIKDRGVERKDKLDRVSDSSALSHYNIEDENASFIKIPDELHEISGITMTDDGRLFGHGDEEADIYQIDYKTGNIIKKFYLGKSSVDADFEDIAFVKDKFYIVTSKGTLLEFKEGGDGEHVDFNVYKTKLNSNNDVEGLCYDKETNSLLLVCKGFPGEGYEKHKAVYSFSMNSMALEEKPRFLIPLSKIKSNTLENEFGPSGIARHPKAGTFFIIAARGNTIIELSKEGEIINQKDLPTKVHKQAEGITFDKDFTLLISNEGKFKLGRIVIYPMKN
ncbi:MAG: SdiA-regulated domain-containing protein [Ignavibacteria bacterium]